MAKLIAAAVAVGILLLVILWALQRQLIYYPTPDRPPAAATEIPGAHDVVLHTSDGLQLGAWFVPGRGTDQETTVLVANGNAGDRSLRAPLARSLSARGFSVLLFDYRGYAGNPGSPSEEGLARDARAAYDYLVSELDVPPGRILFFGESLGSAVVTELATEHPPAGLVLRSPFVDLAAVGRVHFPFLPVGLLLRDRYPLADNLQRVDVPVTVVYGSSDSVVPPAQSRAVAEAAPQLHDLVEVPGADHNDLALLAGRKLIDAVDDLAS